MIYIIYMALAVVAFLVVLNGFLPGAKKTQIEAVLSIFLLGLVIGAFIVLGWKFGLLAIAVPFVAAVISRPIAARTASSLLSLHSRTSRRYVGLAPRPLERISRELGRFAAADLGQVVQEMLDPDNRDRVAHAEQALLDYVESQAAIQAVMKEFHVSRVDLKELYSRLLSGGAGTWAGGHWVAASVLAYPDALRYALSRRGADNTSEEIIKTAFVLVTHFERGSPLKS